MKTSFTAVVRSTVGSVLGSLLGFIPASCVRRPGAVILCTAVLGTLAPALRAAPAAFQVVSYNPGAGFAVNFTNATAALGEPARVNPFGEATDPFNPPYGTNQVVSIGAGGSLVVRFRTPILNHPRNPYGLDLILFGNTGFIITNEFDLTTFNWIGEPATDGSLFGQGTAQAVVSVSHNGRKFHLLDPTRTPALDSFPPTDGAGDDGIPVRPDLGAEEFAGSSLQGIRDLYAGSAGGVGLDLSWAVDAAGHPVRLWEARYLRIDVLSGRMEVDALTLVRRLPRSTRWHADGKETSGSR